MSDDQLSRAQAALDHLLRSQFPAYHGFEASGSVSMEQLGMDSLRAINLLLALEESLGFPLPDEHINADVFQTPNTLLAFVNAAAQMQA